jgi:hypothetical protein
LNYLQTQRQQTQTQTQQIHNQYTFTYQNPMKRPRTRENSSLNTKIGSKVVNNASRLQQNNHHTIHGINVTTIVNYLPISKKLIFIILFIV